MSQVTPSEVLDRRRRAQAGLLARAEGFADDLDPALEVRAVIVFGSVARGDFHDASDVDVLIIADDLPVGALARNRLIGLPPPRVEFVAWTTEEWHLERSRGNPIALEAVDRGVVVRGRLQDR